MNFTNSKDPPMEIESGQLYNFVNVLSVPAAILDPVYDAGGEILDFIYEHLNLPASQSLNSTGTDLTGQKFLGTFFNERRGELLENLKEVFMDGTSLKQGISISVDSVLSPINAVRFGNKLIIQWEDEKRYKDQAERISILQSSNRELEQFAYIASHDLQEPIRMVMSFTQLLQKRYANKLDEDADQFIYYAVDGAKRMKELIDKLLEYSRVSTVKKKWKEINTNQIVENIVEDYGIILNETGTELKFSKLPVVVTDESLLNRVFSNLISNSIRYRGTETPEIVISAEENASEWIFSVADNGIGIEKEYFEKIFLMFQRLHGKTTYPGMGMGLAICKRIIDTLGGRIWLDSSPGTGTTFYFTIPKDTL